MAVTRYQLIGQVLTRLGDTAEQVWSHAEIARYVETAMRDLSLRTRAVWDVLYAENLPKGFSYTAAWEAVYVTFDYGRADHTLATGENDGLVALNMPLTPSGNHTSPFEATGGYLSAAKASTAIPGTSELPETLTEVDRATWDKRTLQPVNLRSLQRQDTRYRVTAGEVYGYAWQQDGVRTLRKVRVPSAQATTYTIHGSWGVMRSPGTQLGTASGTWGIPRRIPSLHPMGPEAFGLPRRPYQDGLNVKIEHWRQARALTADTDVSELPDRYTIALRDYALYQALQRQSAGQNLKLAALFQQRWERAIARVVKRVNGITKDRVGRMGGSTQLSGPPPVAKLPWNFPQRTR